MFSRNRSITAAKKKPTKSLKPLQARKLIRRFHILQKNRQNVLSRLKAVYPELDESAPKNTLGKTYTAEYHRFKLQKNDPELFRIDSSTSEISLIHALARIDAEVDQRGGLHTYQIASTVGQNQQRGGDSLKWLVKTFENLGKPPATSTLEIGCLSPTNAILTSGVFGSITRIDLNSQHPQILQQDFMQRPLPANDTEKFNVISCSLVLNFVPTPKDRGNMLWRMTQFLRAPSPEKPSVSCLFLVLPLPCVSNSRYFDKNLLLKIMILLGYTETAYYEAKKVAYWLYDWNGESKMSEFIPKKKELRSGSGRNNFFIDMDFERGDGQFSESESPQSS